MSFSIRDTLSGAARRLADVIAPDDAVNYVNAATGNRRPGADPTGDRAGSTPEPTSRSLSGGTLGGQPMPERQAPGSVAHYVPEIPSGSGPSGRLAAAMASDSRAPRPGYGLIATGSRGETAPPAGGMPGGELDASVQGSVKPTLVYGNN